MTTLAYLRVSKDTQDTKNQRLAILEFAHAERIAVDEFLELQASSRRSAKVRKVDLLLARLAPGDTLLVSELSRLGRSVGEIITLIDTLGDATDSGVRPQGRAAPDRRTRSADDRHGDPVWPLCGDRTDVAIPADERSPRGRESGGQAVGPAPGDAGQVEARRERGGDQDLARLAGLQGLDRQNHGRGPRDALPFYAFTRTYAEVMYHRLWTGGSLFFAPKLREPPLPVATTVAQTTTPPPETRPPEIRFVETRDDHGKTGLWGLLGRSISHSL